MIVPVLPTGQWCSPRHPALSRGGRRSQWLRGSPPAGGRAASGSGLSGGDTGQNWTEAPAGEKFRLCGRFASPCPRRLDYFRVRTGSRLLQSSAAPAAPAVPLHLRRGRSDATGATLGPGWEPSLAPGGRQPRARVETAALPGQGGRPGGPPPNPGPSTYPEGAGRLWPGDAPPSLLAHGTAGQKHRDRVGNDPMAAARPVRHVRTPRST